jgi:hypothetical protein
MRSEAEHRAILALVNVQEGLLRGGWNALLDGHYATAAQPTRLIAEANDYIMAARYLRKGVEKPCSPAGRSASVVYHRCNGCIPRVLGKKLSEKGPAWSSGWVSRATHLGMRGGSV